MIRSLMVLVVFALTAASQAREFRHFGDFVLKSQYKLTGDRMVPVPIKPVKFSVFTDGVQVKVMVDGNEEAATVFDVYRSDGIGRQRPGAMDLEVVPGVQAMSNRGGVLRHLRLTQASMSMTTFPGVSDQTVVVHAVSTSQNPLASPAKPLPKSAVTRPDPP